MPRPLQGWELGAHLPRDALVTHHPCSPRWILSTLPSLNSLPPCRLFPKSDLLLCSYLKGSISQLLLNFYSLLISGSQQIMRSFAEKVQIWTQTTRKLWRYQNQLPSYSRTEFRTSYEIYPQNLLSQLTLSCYLHCTVGCASSWPCCEYLF